MTAPRGAGLLAGLGMRMGTAWKGIKGVCVLRPSWLGVRAICIGAASAAVQTVGGRSPHACKRAVGYWQLGASPDGALARLSDPSGRQSEVGELLDFHSPCRKTGR